MKGGTVCVMLKYDRESLDKAPMDGGVDVLRHFEESINFEYKKWWSAQKWRVGRFASCWKTIHFKEKFSIKRPWMEGWTFYVILKKLYMRFSVGSDFHITLDNMKFIQVNFIQSYREMKFGENSQTCITLWKKILRPRKKWNMNKFYFPKIERPGFGGVDALRQFAKIM